MPHHLLARRSMLPLLLCLAGTGVRSSPHAQEPPAAAPAPAASAAPAQAVPETVPRFHTRVDLVAVNVTVLDRLHRLVSGLPPERFEVFEDGVKQEISYFENVDVPLDVVLLIDTSSSMYNKLRAIRLTSAAFARALRAGDRGAVLVFSNRVTQGVPLTAEANILDTAIRSIRAGGGTSLYDSIYIALRGLSSGSFLPAATELENGGGGAGHQAERLRRQAIVVLTDGTDTTSLMSFETVQEEARRANVMIYAICLLESPHTVLPEEAPLSLTRLDVNMRELSRDTGGLAFAVRSEAELAAAYDRVTSELMHQYILAYSPKQKRLAPSAGASPAALSGPSPAPSPGFHRIVIHLRDVPDATARARTGYLWSSGATAARRTGEIK